MGWKIYAWFMLILFCGVIFTDEVLYQFDVIYTSRKIISLLLVAGTMAYVYNKKLFSYIFWRIELILAILDEGWSFFEFISKPDALNSDIVHVIVLILVYALMFPCFYALYLYSCKNIEFWSTDVPGSE